LTGSLDTFAFVAESQAGVSIHTCEVEVYGDDRWYMIRIPELDGLTQARHPGEIEDMARSYIAVSTDQPIDTVAVRFAPPR